jgi:hypothetical protein
MQRDKGLKPGTPCSELGGGEFIGPGSRAIDQVGDPDATLHKVRAVLLRHRFTSVKITIYDAGQSQRRIETVPGMCEVRLRCGRPQARIDADEEQLQPWADQIGE